MSNRDEFRKWKNMHGELGVAIWQAACELKDEEITALRAELDALKSREPAAYYDHKAECFMFPPKDGTPPFARAWKPLYTRPVPAIPDGYVLVPVEPTEEMLVFGQEEYVLGSKGAMEDCIEAGDIYKAMLAASQTEVKP